MKTHGRTLGAVMAIATLAIVTGCSASGGAATGVGYVGSGAKEATSVAPPRSLDWMEWPAPTDSEVTPQGYQVKGLNDTVAIINPDTGQPAARLMVRGIEKDSACTSPDAEASENGHFFRVDLQVETGADLAEAMGSPELFLADWSAADENGIDTNADLITEASAWCLTEAESIPTIVDPGRRVLGSIVLDMPFTAGTVVLNSYHGESWQFSLPE